MKLLLDQNLSYRLLARLEPVFPGSTQVHRLGMEQADDEAIWRFATAQGYVIVTKDSDFHEKGLLRGFPPQVIWLKCGNVDSRRVARLLNESEAVIKAFLAQQESACLEIY